ncbi:hypothetical protein lerEdw1_005214 [Lerista edwardsae]|nr:hypothetical protein lerEdw1_005214 [Lerista edwardsae]
MGSSPINFIWQKSVTNDSNVLLGELGPCSATDKQTCLKTVVLLIDHKQNQLTRWFSLPASFSVFQPSSYYLMVDTYFGLKLQIQLVPMMQLFTIVDESAKGILQGKYEHLSSTEEPH